MYESVPVIIVVIGVTSLFVTFYYGLLVNNILKMLSKLLKLQDARNDDVEQYIRTIASTLEEIGVEQVYYDIVYAGRQISSLPNSFDKATMLKKEIFYKNIDGYLLVKVKKNGGEYKLVNKLILFVVTLQIVNAIHTDIEKINESFVQIAKLQTYMMHDLKNILQFFQAMQYNVEHIKTDEQKERFISYLQNSTQPINKKVNRLLALLQIKTHLRLTAEKKEIDLPKLIQELATQYRLKCHIFGSGTLKSDEASVCTVLENLFSNIRYKTGNDPDIECSAKIESDETTLTLKIQDSGEKFANPQSVLRPFYTTKTDGLGIGMYQVKTVVELLGGTIECANEEEKPTVTITLPRV